MILASCAIGIMYHISDKFDEYLKVELKKRNIPIQGKHAGLFMILFSNNNLEFKEIADIWRKSKSTLCDIISRYVDAGLIEKVNCSLDKRHVYVKLSSEGLKYAKDFDEIAAEFLEQATSDLTAQQKEELKVILLNIKNNLRK